MLLPGHIFYPFFKKCFHLNVYIIKQIHRQKYVIFVCDSQMKDSGGKTEWQHHVSVDKCHLGGCYHEADSSLLATPPLPERSGRRHRDASANARGEHLAQLDSKPKLITV